MRVLYVVQRYGEEIAGGAEQHARAFAERLAQRDHNVTVLTTCAQSYVDWSNAFPRGWSRINDVAVFRAPVAARRNHHLFGRFNSRLSNAPSLRPLALQREWMQMQGPYAPDVVPWLRHHARTYDVVVFITYLYWLTWAGLRECAGDEQSRRALLQAALQWLRCGPGMRLRPSGRGRCRGRCCRDVRSPQDEPSSVR